MITASEAKRLSNTTKKAAQKDAFDSLLISLEERIREQTADPARIGDENLFISVPAIFDTDSFINILKVLGYSATNQGLNFDETQTQILVSWANATVK